MRKKEEAKITKHKKKLHDNLIFKPKKLLGQNFLFEKDYVQKIAELSLILSDNNRFVEVGPGYGSLTSFIQKKAEKIPFVPGIYHTRSDGTT